MQICNFPHDANHALKSVLIIIIRNTRHRDASKEFTAWFIVFYQNELGDNFAKTNSDDLPFPRKHLMINKLHKVKGIHSLSKTNVIITITKFKNIWNFPITKSKSQVEIQLKWILCGPNVVIATLKCLPITNTFTGWYDKVSVCVCVGMRRHYYHTGCQWSWLITFLRFVPRSQLEPFISGE